MIITIYRLCDQRILHLQGCMGELSYIREKLQCHCARDSHNHRDPLAFLVRQRSINVPVLKYLNRDICRIKKSQAWNYDKCSELK